MKSRTRSSLYIRNIIFGVEDSLVSTVGLLSGIAAGHVADHTILLTGFVYITVEAFSMSVGSFLSEESAEEAETGAGADSLAPALGAMIMFVSFFVAGFFPILPYLLPAGDGALYWSIALSIFLLGVLGFISATYSRVSVWKRTFRMAILGGLAIVIGIVVAKSFGVS